MQDLCFRQTTTKDKDEDMPMLSTLMLPQIPQVPSRKNSMARPPVDELIFDVYREDNNTISVLKFLTELKVTGIRKNDPRLQKTILNFLQHKNMDEGEPLNIYLDFETFRSCISENLDLISRALRNKLVIPDFQEFKAQIEEIFYKCNFITGGTISSSNQQLMKRHNQDNWAVSVCTVDGQRASWGDHKTPFCLLSVSKCLNYAIALNTLGAEYVHQYVGQEPSGRFSNDICLDYNNKPHNPMINTGAIVIVSMLKKDLAMADRFDFVIDMYKKMAGGGHIEFSNPTFLSEREAADRSYALSFYLREHNCFPEGTNLKDTLDLFFQLNAVEVTCDAAAVIAATLANGGVCPITDESVLTNRSVRDVLSLMYSCGMYDYSGHFAFTVGLPAKSSASGLMIVAVPNVMGIALWSPPLGEMGCSIRGVKFCEELVQKFSVHNYDIMMSTSSTKIDPTKRQSELKGTEVMHVLFAAQSGDMGALERLAAKGSNMGITDYDGRSALHIAASEGNVNVVKYLLEKCDLDPEVKDRWGKRPIDDARDFGNESCAKFIEEWQKRHPQKAKNQETETPFPGGFASTWAA